MSRFVHATVVNIFVLGFLATGSQAQDTGRASGTAGEEVPEVVKVLRLEHSHAEEMQRIVGELFGTFGRGRSSGTGIRTSFDARTNSLIVVGPEEDLAVIEALCERLDTPAPAGRQNTTEGNSLSQLRKRVDRIERLVAGLRAGADRARSARLNRDRPESVSSSSLQTARLEEIAGTRIRIETCPPNCTTMQVASVVPDGKRVKKGDLLIALDSGPLENAVDKQQVAVERAQAALIQAEAVVKNTLIQQQTQAAESILQIDLAKLELDEFQEGTRPLQLKIYEKEVKRVKRELDKQKVLVGTGRVDAKSIDGPKADLEVAEAELQVFKKFTAPKKVKELESAIAAAKREAQKVRRQAEVAVKSVEASLASQRAQVEFEVERLKRLNSDLAKCKISAPHDGVVAHAGPLQIREGSNVRERQVVLILSPDGGNGDSKK